MASYEPDRLSKFFLTTVEQQPRRELLLPADVGVPIRCAASPQDPVTKSVHARCSMPSCVHCKVVTLVGFRRCPALRLCLSRDGGMRPCVTLLVTAEGLVTPAITLVVTVCTPAV
jgi:hypothetical protein